MASKAVNMNKKLISKLDNIRADYAMVAGKSFDYFYPGINFTQVATTRCGFYF